MTGMRDELRAERVNAVYRHHQVAQQVAGRRRDPRGDWAENTRIAPVKLLTPLAAICILSHSVFSRQPLGEVSKRQDLQNNRNPPRFPQ